MEAQDLQKKIDITWAAVDLHIEYGRISIPDLVNAAGISASEIYELFPNKKAILAYYYPALVLQYWVMIDEIEGFEQFSISEKFSNFVYTTFDMMHDKLPFVQKTFEHEALSLLGESEFKNEVKSLFKDFLSTDANIAVSAAFFMNDLFYGALATQYLLLVKYWLWDNSPDKERSLALADKMTTLFEELIYNKSVDKTFDLLKFILNSNKMEDWFPNWDVCHKQIVLDEEIEIEVTDEEEDETTLNKDNDE